MRATLALVAVLMLAACSSPLQPSQQVDYTVTAQPGTSVTISGAGLPAQTILIGPTGEWDASVLLSDQPAALHASTAQGCLSVQARTYAPVSVKTDTECGTPATAHVGPQ